MSSYIHLGVFTVDANLSIIGRIVAQAVEIVNELPSTLMRVVAFAFRMILHITNCLEVSSPGRYHPAGAKDYSTQCSDW